MGGYDISQICMSGHIISDRIGYYSDKSKPFCVQCGEKTIIACPSCKSNIHGAYTPHGSYNIIHMRQAPSFCHNCGKPYPWTESKIQTAIQIFAEFGGLDDEEMKQTEEDLKNIARDVPQSELSAMRIKKIWENGKAIAYETVMEFASRTAAKILNP